MTFFPWRNSPPVGQAPHYRGFTVTLTHTTFGRTPLDEWSARHRDLYLTTQNIHKRQTSMSLGGIRTLNPKKLAAADPHLERTATGSGPVCDLLLFNSWSSCNWAVFGLWNPASERVWISNKNNAILSQIWIKLGWHPSASQVLIQCEKPNLKSAYLARWWLG